MEIDKNPPSVLVLITSFNNGKYLRNRVDSILAQTYANFRILIIDDNSSDDSRNIIKDYHTCKNLEYRFNEFNLGISKTINLAIKDSEEDYLLIAESDDISDSDLLTSLVKSCESTGSSASFCNSRIIDESGNFLQFDFENRTDHFKEFTTKNKLISPKMALNWIYQSCFIPNLSAALISIPSIKRIGGFNEKFHVSPDWEMWGRLFKNEMSVSYVADPLNYFRTHNHSVRARVSSISGLHTQLNEAYQIYWYLYPSIIDNSSAKIASPIASISRFYANICVNSRLRALLHFSVFLKVTNSYFSLLYVFYYVLLRIFNRILR